MKTDCFLDIMSKHDVKMLAYENTNHGMSMMFNFKKESYVNVTDYFFNKNKLLFRQCVKMLAYGNGLCH